MFSDFHSFGWAKGKRMSKDEKNKNEKGVYDDEKNEKISGLINGDGHGHGAGCDGTRNKS